MPFRGSRGGRGRGRGRGGPVLTGRIARSGIRTRTGYKKFDSQRIREVDPDEAQRDVTPEEESESEHSTASESEDDQGSKLKAYNALLQTFHQPDQNQERQRKRRKVEIDADEEERVQPGLKDDNDQIEDVVLDENSQSEAADIDEEAADIDEEAAAMENGAFDDDEDEDQSDPFEVRLGTDETTLKNRVEASERGDWQTTKSQVDGIGNLTFSTLQGSDTGQKRNQVHGVEDLNLKQKLAQTAKKRLGVLTKFQRTFAAPLFGYSDIMLGNRTPGNAESIRLLSCLHALNHILKGRDRVLRNTAKLARAETPEELDLRDQGFTRPKVLILLETRQMAARYADCIAELFDPEQQENKQRFKDSFLAPIEDREHMPADYRELFDGNNDNNFLTALKFTRKTLKYFSPFYSSDIIIASPLGLRRIIEHEDHKKRDYDFLSSIEILITDQTDAMQMQNWENVELVFRHLNQPLREAHGCDFNRVRYWYLDGNAKYLRQTIVLSAYISPEMNRLYNTSMSNTGGKVKLLPYYEGAITEVSGLGLKQTFSRFDSLSPATDPDTRFKYFTTAILPRLLRLPKPADGAHGILVFVPSYFDFVRIRNFFATSTMTENISFGAIHDYSEVSDQRRAKSHFTSGRHSILLYTQRAHHFFRLRLRGVKRVVMYGLPDNPVFYEELVGGFVGTTVNEGKVSPEESSVRAMFSKWDGLRLERIVGSSRIKSMLGGQGDTFDFV